jgi:ankyrin repeat protein
MSNSSKKRFYVPFTSLSGELPEQGHRPKGPNWEAAWDGQKSIWQAAAEGDVQSLQQFLEHGVDLDLYDNEYLTPLSYAANEGRLEAVEFLLNHGAKVNEVDLRGWTPLMWAATAGHLEVVKRLLENGAETHVRLFADSEETSAKEVAAEKGHFDIAQLIDERECKS